MRTVEVRCPEDPRRLFTKLRLQGKTRITEGNLIEFACAECRKLYMRKGVQTSLVLHRYNFIGEFVEDEIVP